MTTMSTTTATTTATTAAQADNRSEISLRSIILTATFGLGIMFAAGFAQSAVIHDAQHDTRHAIGFPCH
ncbi:MAG: CbtB-domain containing protein [Rhodobacteraceae bacterium]|nr:CbtB-domain containing protein [Paracoccaceae bacterium]